MDIRPPHISGATTEERVAQIIAYLQRLARELQAQ